MGYSVRLADLSRMPKSDSDRVLGELVASAKRGRNGQSAILNARIQELECRYEMSSVELKTRLASGDIRETADIAHWLFLLAARDSGAER